MSPEQFSALTAIAAIISNVGAWPLGSILFSIVFGPWVGMWMVSRSIERRHKAAIEMYESNVKLVKNYERMAEEQTDTIRLSVAATTELTTYLRTKTPCHQLISTGMINLSKQRGGG
jgi:hypothetical protein